MSEATRTTTTPRRRRGMRVSQAIELLNAFRKLPERQQDLFLEFAKALADVSGTPAARAKVDEYAIIFGLDPREVRA